MLLQNEIGNNEEIDFVRRFVRDMFILDGVPADKLKDDDELFEWAVSLVDSLLDRGAAYGDAWATVQHRLYEHFSKEV